MTARDSYPLSAFRSTPAKHRPPYKILLGSLIAGAVAVLLIATGSWLWLSREITVTGEVRLRADHFASKGGHCAGEGSHSDIREGAQVVISDDSGATLALGRLSWGQWGQRSDECVFAFTVQGVPGNHDYYGLQIANRNILKVSRTDLDSHRVLLLGQ